MEVSALWWSWDKSWKSLVLFINSRSLDSHIKCSKLREMNFTMINCATNTIDNENLLCGFICMVAGKTQVMLRLLIYNWNCAYQNLIYSKCIQGRVQFGLPFPLTHSLSSLKRKVRIQLCSIALGWWAPYSIMDRVFPLKIKDEPKSWFKHLTMGFFDAENP